MRKAGNAKKKKKRRTFTKMSHFLVFPSTLQSPVTLRSVFPGVRGAKVLLDLSVLCLLQSRLWQLEASGCLSSRLCTFGQTHHNAMNSVLGHMVGSWEYPGEDSRIIQPVLSFLFTSKMSFENLHFLFIYPKPRFCYCLVCLFCNKMRLMVEGRALRLLIAEVLMPDPSVPQLLA